MKQSDWLDVGDVTLVDAEVGFLYIFLQYIKYILYNNAIYLIINNMHNILNYSVHRGGKNGEAMQP